MATPTTSTSRSPGARSSIRAALAERCYSAGMAEPDPSSPYRVGAEPIEQLIVTTGNEVAGHDIVKYLAIVRGIVVRATSIGQGLLGSLRALGGGNIAEFTEVCEAARHDAYQQMIQHAQEFGADAIIG